MLRRLKTVVAEAYGILAPAQQIRASLTVLWTGNRQIQNLNRDYRGKNKTTNVLSFPQFDLIEITKIGRKGAQHPEIYLGDIAISYPYIVAEARKNHKILINHALHMIIHALLHLLGYDHISDREALRMERLETKIMAALDLPDPYSPAQLREQTPEKAAGRKRRSAGHRVK